MMPFMLAKGQQVATYAQYMFNGLAINPAYAGSEDVLTVSAISRHQNLGLEGAPNTQTLAGHAPLLNKRIALGAMFIHDKFGVIDQTGVHFAYVYRIPFDKKRKLSFGLQSGIITYRANYSNLTQHQPSDPVFSEDIRQTRPNFGAGAYYTTDKLYIGLSMPHLMNNVFDRGSDLTTVYQSVPVVVNAGYLIQLTRDVKFKPNMLFKALDRRPIELDLNANFLFDEIIWLGVSYKVANAVNLIFELQISNQLRLGYSYAISASKVRYVDLGSHEVLLSYRFRYQKYGVITPRYF